MIECSVPRASTLGDCSHRPLLVGVQGVGTVIEAETAQSRHIIRSGSLVSIDVHFAGTLKIG